MFLPKCLRVIAFLYTTASILLMFAGVIATVQNDIRTSYSLLFICTAFLSFSFLLVYIAGIIEE